MIKQNAAPNDLFPTLLELCDVPRPETAPLDGISLVPLLEGRTNYWPDRILFDQYLLPGPHGKTTGALRTQRFRMVNDGRGWEMFDMQTDPGETADVGAQHSDLRQKLVSAYDQWWKKILPAAQRPVPPISVGYPQENPVELSVPEAEFDHGLRFSGRYANNAWLTGWTNTAATVNWDLEAARSGVYDVSLEFLCAPANAGARIRVTVGGAGIETVIPGTAIRQVPSPDRVPRIEVYEMEWSTLKVELCRWPGGRIHRDGAEAHQPRPVCNGLESRRARTKELIPAFYPSQLQNEFNLPQCNIYKARRFSSRVALFGLMSVLPAPAFSQVWWNNFPRIAETTSLADALSYSANAAMNGVDNDPAWGLWFTYGNDNGSEASRSPAPNSRRPASSASVTMKAMVRVRPRFASCSGIRRISNGKLCIHGGVGKTTAAGPLSGLVPGPGLTVSRVTRLPIQANSAILRGPTPE